MQTFVLNIEGFIPKKEDKMTAKTPYRTPEGDMCDLDPNKVCDNCMKCVKKNGADYAEILADFDPESIRIFTPGEDEDAVNEPIPGLDIDPELMAEWEEKLKLAEEADRQKRAEPAEEAGESEEPIGYRGSRKRREHISHIQKNKQKPF